MGDLEDTDDFFVDDDFDEGNEDDGDDDDADFDMNPAESSDGDISQRADTAVAAVQRQLDKLEGKRKSAFSKASAPGVNVGAALASAGAVAAVVGLAAKLLLGRRSRRSGKKSPKGKKVVKAGTASRNPKTSVRASAAPAQQEQPEAAPQKIAKGLPALSKPRPSARSSVKPKPKPSADPSLAPARSTSPPQPAHSQPSESQPPPAESKEVRAPEPEASSPPMQAQEALVPAAAEASPSDKSESTPSQPAREDVASAPANAENIAPSAADAPGDESASESPRKSKEGSDTGASVIPPTPTPSLQIPDSETSRARQNLPMISPDAKPFVPSRLTPSASPSAAKSGTPLSQAVTDAISPNAKPFIPTRLTSSSHAPSSGPSDQSWRAPPSASQGAAKATSTLSAALKGSEVTPTEAKEGAEESSSTPADPDPSTQTALQQASQAIAAATAAAGGSSGSKPGNDQGRTPSSTSAAGSPARGSPTKAAQEAASANGARPASAGSTSWAELTAAESQQSSPVPDAPIHKGSIGARSSADHKPPALQEVKLNVAAPEFKPTHKPEAPTLVTSEDTSEQATGTTGGDDEPPALEDEEVQGEEEPPAADEEETTTEEEGVVCADDDSETFEYVNLDLRGKDIAPDAEETADEAQADTNLVQVAKRLQSIAAADATSRDVTKDGVEELKQDVAFCASHMCRPAKYAEHASTAADFFYQVGDYAAAEEILHGAIQAATMAGNAQLQATLANNMGTVLRKRRKYKKALALAWTQVAELEEAHGLDSQYFALARHNLLDLLRALKRIDEAKEFMAEQFEKYDALVERVQGQDGEGEEKGIAIPSRGTSTNGDRADEPSTALVDASAAGGDGGDETEQDALVRALQARARCHLDMARFMQGSHAPPAEAIPHARKALTLYQDASQEAASAQALQYMSTLANLLSQKGRASKPFDKEPLAEAKDLHCTMLEILQSSAEGHARNLAYLYQALAKLCLDLGDNQEAFSYGKQVVHCWAVAMQGNQHHPNLIPIWRFVEDLHRQGGDAKGADQARRSALKCKSAGMKYRDASHKAKKAGKKARR